MNQLKIKARITCNTCGCKLVRTKTIKVNATNKESAIAEATQKTKEWHKSLHGKNCKVCQSIIDSLEEFVKLNKC